MEKLLQVRCAGIVRGDSENNIPRTSETWRDRQMTVLSFASATATDRNDAAAVTAPSGGA